MTFQLKHAYVAQVIDGPSVLSVGGEPRGGCMLVTTSGQLGNVGIEKRRHKVFAYKPNVWAWLLIASNSLKWMKVGIKFSYVFS